MTGTEQKKSSNKIMIIVIVVIAVAGIGIFTISEQNTVTKDAKDLISDIKTDAEDIDPGYGQVTKQDGAYSP